MIIAGLTGSIAAGKSTVAELLEEMGIPVFNSDSAVHTLYRDLDFAKEMEKQFPGSVDSQGVARSKLAAIVLHDREKLRRLERLVHPEVRKMEHRFRDEKRAEFHKLIVVDIPLLFETKRESDFDVVIVVSAPAHIRKERAMTRAGMTDEKWQRIDQQQMPDDDKRKRADFVIMNDAGRDALAVQVKALVVKLHAAAKE
jgi:dephospho-CoA kinase